MSRPIRFRAWDTKKQAWAGMWIFRGGHSGQQDGFKEPVILDMADALNLENNLGEHLRLMQFTGLTDKNGKEVYEGDIVRYESDAYNNAGEKVRHKSTHQVRFVDGCFVDEDHQRLAGLLDAHDNSTCEVIGNRWENPELLESK